jgi:hypothetical protein
MLNRRQARWSEFLSRFNFKITYRPGKQGEKPDALTRRSEDLPKEGDERLEHQSRTMLKRENLELPPTPPQTPELSQKNVRFADPISKYYPISDSNISKSNEPNQQQDLSKSVNTLIVNSEPLPPIEVVIRQESQNDENVLSVMYAVEQGKNKHPFLQLSQCQVQEGILRYRDKIYVPDSDELRIRILQQHHDHPSAGHPGRAKTFELLSRSYYWKGMNTDTRRYVQNCRTCGRTKPRHDRHQGLLQPLPIPERPWQDISIDFITHLPKSNGFDAILVVVDRLTKMRHYIPCLMTDSAEEVARLFVREIYRLHGVPLSVVSDRDIRFVNSFWEHLSNRLQFNMKLTVAHRPQGDGQTERMNAILEQHLRAYVSYL